MDTKTLYGTIKDLTTGTVKVEAPALYEDDMHKGVAAAIKNFEAKKEAVQCLCDAQVIAYDEKAQIIVCQDSDENGTYRIEIPADAYSIQAFVAKYLRINKRICFYIVDSRVDKETGETVYIGDRRAVQQDFMRDSLVNYKVRDSIIIAKIIRVKKSSIFLDIGYGISTCLSVVTLNVIGDSCVSRVSYKVGDAVAVILLEPIREDNTIVVSQRELLGNWEDNAGTLCNGDVMCGVAACVCDFGTFVALTENIFGLTEPTTTVVSGQYVTVSINRIIPEKRKIKLGLVSDNNNCNGGACVSNRTHYYIKSYCTNVQQNKDRWCYYRTPDDHYDTQFSFEQRSVSYPRTYRASVRNCQTLDAQYKE